VEKDTIERLRGRLRELRELHAITQEEFAHMAGLDYKFYQSIEAGRRKEIRVSTLEKIAKAYGIEVYQLLAPELPKTKLADFSRGKARHILKRTGTKTSVS
jgi:transcriptional regulator with XRE-family HTH domain